MKMQWKKVREWSRYTYIDGLGNDAARAERKQARDQQTERANEECRRHQEKE